MLEASDQENQEKKPEQQTQTEKSKNISWKKIIIVVLAAAVVLAILGSLYWYLVLNKTDDTSIESTKVSTSSAQQATPSAKETTQAEKESQKTNETQSKEETDNWKTYTGKYIKVTFKYSPSWEVNEVDGVDTGEGKENTKISLNEAATDRNLSITENFLGGFAGLTQTSEKNITVGGVQTKKTYFVNEDETDMQMHIQFSKNGKDYYIIGSWDAEDAGADEVVDQILATLKFL